MYAEYCIFSALLGLSGGSGLQSTQTSLFSFRKLELKTKYHTCIFFTRKYVCEIKSVLPDLSVIPISKKAIQRVELIQNVVTTAVYLVN